MTAYHGGKQKIGKELSKIIYNISMKISEEEDFKIKGYCEPFCGMLGVYQHITDLFKETPIKYKAGDTNKSVILMWKEVQKGWTPPTSCTEAYYQILRYDGKENAEKGFIGHQCSFGGIPFGSYALKYGRTKEAVKSASANVKRIGKEMKNVDFSYGEYTQFSNLKGYIIYCDPPYSSTTQKYKNRFDNKKFWEWCNDMSENNIIFISEYKAPKGIKKVFEKKVILTGKTPIKRQRIEKLYVI